MSQVLREYRDEYVQIQMIQDGELIVVLVVINAAGAKRRVEFVHITNAIVCFNAYVHTHTSPENLEKHLQKHNTPKNPT